MAPTLASYEPFLAHYDLANAAFPGSFTLTDLPWNWKVMFENFNDGYHANRLHHTIQDFCPSNLAAFPVPWDEASNVIFRTNGYIHIDGGFNATTKALLPVFPDLTEEERWRSTFALVPPTLCLGTAPDQAFYFIVTPKTAETIDVEIGYLLHPSALDHPMFEHLFAMSDAGVQVFVKQDQDATTKVQRGMHSRFAARGRYSWQEESHVQFNRWLVQRYRRTLARPWRRPKEIHVTRPARLRRSELSTPGSSKKMMAKAATSDADVVFLDLEDAVAPNAKIAARQMSVAALTRLDWGSKTRAVRINGPDTQWCHDDLIEVVTGAGAAIDIVIVPKVKAPRDVWFIDTLLSQLEDKLGAARAAASVSRS